MTDGGVPAARQAADRPPLIRISSAACILGTGEEQTGVVAALTLSRERRAQAIAIGGDRWGLAAKLGWSRTAGSASLRAEPRAGRAEPRARLSKHFQQQAEPGSARVLTSLIEPSHEPARLGSIPPLRVARPPARPQPSACHSSPSSSARPRLH